MNVTEREREIIRTCAHRDLATLFPQHDLIELKRIRLRSQKTHDAKMRRQRYYREDGEGAAICPSERKMIEDARMGSATLLAALIRTGQRP